MYALNFYSPLVADQLRSGRKSATIRLGDKSGKYKKGMVVRVLCGVRFSPREHVFDAVIDKVEVKTLGDLSPREIEHDNPEIRRTDEMAELPRPALQPRRRDGRPDHGHPLLADHERAGLVPGFPEDKIFWVVLSPARLAPRRASPKLLPRPGVRRAARLTPSVGDAHGERVHTGAELVVRGRRLARHRRRGIERAGRARDGAGRRPRKVRVQRPWSRERREADSGRTREGRGDRP